jgi:hypothetical protein
MTNPTFNFDFDFHSTAPYDDAQSLVMPTMPPKIAEAKIAEAKIAKRNRQKKPPKEATSL